MILKKSKWLLGLCSVILCLLFFDDLILYKEFSEISYGSLFKILSLGAAIIISLMTIIFYSRNSYDTGLNLLFLVMIILQRQSENIYLEYFSLLIFMLALYCYMYLKTPFRISSTIFNDVREMVLDYIFITDKQGKVIYKNFKFSEVGIFKILNVVNLNHINELFNQEVVIRKAYNMVFFKYNGSVVRYFSYSHKSIEDQGKIVGQIITLTDMTDLVDLLDNLKIKEEETWMIHQALKLQEESVYELEKEKEIHHLLKEIANNQQVVMIQLKQKIDALKPCDENMTLSLSDLIDACKDNLEDVRAAVTTYMDYYTEGELK